LIRVTGFTGSHLYGFAGRGSSGSFRFFMFSCAADLAEQGSGARMRLEGVAEL
jgi:hypothetical protein